MYKPIGYYLNCDDAVCTDDAPAGFANEDYSEWSGFEGWETPAVIFDHEESDTPTHCKTCEALIPHALTSDGADYVAEKIGSNLGDTGHTVRYVSEWWDEYGDGLSEDQLREIITEALGQRAKAEQSEEHAMPDLSQA